MMAASTARCMGLRTCRQGPATTRRCVGAIGAGVPRPCVTKTSKAQRIVVTPAMIRRVPATRSDSEGVCRACQPVSHHGTSPATTPGASAKNPALPSAAARFGVSRFRGRSPATMAE